MYWSQCAFFLPPAPGSVLCRPLFMFQFPAGSQTIGSRSNPSCLVCLPNQLLTSYGCYSVSPAIFTVWGSEFDDALREPRERAKAVRFASGRTFTFAFALLLLLLDRQKVLYRPWVTNRQVTRIAKPHNPRAHRYSKGKLVSC
jgi:hypothetical protein